MAGVIYTVDANCQDCYRCVRVCPVGAIRVEHGQARVEEALCVACGTCVRECPQHAKAIRDDLERARELLRTGASVAVSLAPSFAAAFPGWRAARLPAALRKLGFAKVYETAEGARAVAEASHRLRGAGSICTCCPAVVSYIEKYKPELTPQLLPVASPMVIHGRMIKARLGARTRVVFIGPCAAKKGEALRPENADAVDVVLTFEELSRWLESEAIDLASCPESFFDPCGDVGQARLFPLEGGLLKTAGVEADAGSLDVVHVSGSREIMTLLDTPPSQWPYALAELMFCRGGCVGGPCMPKEQDAFSASRAVAAYAAQAITLPGDTPAVPMDAAFAPTPVASILPEVSEARIREILESTGKAEAANQLNCGACGYPTCRDNAIAVARGMAEPGMCVSYARQRAERRAEIILETSPNGIVIVDENLTVLHMNARFARMFSCDASQAGSPVSRWLDPEGFERLLAGAEGTQEAIRVREGLKYHELIYALPVEGQMVGIFVDVTAATFDARQVDLLKDQSLRGARELLEHQIRFAQEMAHYLGKSTAQTEELVKQLMGIFAEDTPR